MSEDEILWVDETLPGTVRQLWEAQHRTQLEAPMSLREIFAEMDDA